MFKGLAGKEKSALQDVAMGWKEKELKEVLSKYERDDVFSAEETTLLFKLWQSEATRLRVSRDPRRESPSCCSMSGSVKAIMLVVGKLQELQAFKNMCSLPVDHDYKKKTWMTTSIFAD